MHVIDDSTECTPAEPIFPSYGLAAMTVKLSQIFSGPDAQLQLQATLRACRTPSARVDLRRILMQARLLQHAQSQNCTRIYVGDNCTRMAIDVMAETCAGRGGALPWKLATTQELAHGICVVRPLREVVEAEAVNYLGLIASEYNITTSPDAPVADAATAKPDSIYALTDSIAIFGKALIMHVRCRVYSRIGLGEFGHHKYDHPDMLQNQDACSAGHSVCPLF